VKVRYLSNLEGMDVIALLEFLSLPGGKRLRKGDTLLITEGAEPVARATILGKPNAAQEHGAVRPGRRP
jgi:hypothetical protein